MELKNTIAVCLISLFSATLVTLIAQSLDSKVAARLEPQLARIVEELEAIRASGGIPSATAGRPTLPLDDGLIVYYFYGNVRCPTCRAIESQSYDAVQEGFGSELSEGRVAWKMLNYEEPVVGDLVTKFAVSNPVVVLAKMKDGQIEKWDRLDEVWGLVDDKSAFATFVRSEISAMLNPISDESAESDASDIPIPDENNIPIPDDDAADIPLPDASDDSPTGEQDV